MNRLLMLLTASIAATSVYVASHEVRLPDTRPAEIVRLPSPEPSPTPAPSPTPVRPRHEKPAPRAETIVESCGQLSVMAAVTHMGCMVTASWNGLLIATHEANDCDADEVRAIVETSMNGCVPGDRDITVLGALYEREGETLYTTGNTVFNRTYPIQTKRPRPGCYKFEILDGYVDVDGERLYESFAPVAVCFRRSFVVHGQVRGVVE